MKSWPRLLKKATIFTAFAFLAGAVIMLLFGANNSLAQSSDKVITTEAPARIAADSTEISMMSESETGLYIVRLEGDALASYQGGVADLAATSPKVTGASRLNVNAPESVAYLNYLKTQHAQFVDNAATTLGRSLEVEFQYLNVLNALAVRVDYAEAQRLATLPGVVAVYPDQVRELTTDVGPALIGAPTFWDGDFGFDEHRGEGVIVGMLDTGVNYEHPSFAAVDGDGYVHVNPYGSGNFVGVCDSDNDDQVFDDICNDKLIGAWSFVSGSNSGDSARDWNNHGSHVGGTIAGNLHDAEFSVGGDVFTRTISGVAPRANIISYMVCDPSCPNSSSVAAVNQAIADGVDVLNYSISGSDDPWNDIVDLAFLDATAAGMFVSASAGNDGPGASTVAKTGPWNASVAASTHSRVVANTVDVTAPSQPVELQSLAAVPGSGPDIDSDIEGEIVWAGDVDSDNIRGCDPFPANAFDGVIALIQRGDCTFATKVDNADDAGAVAVIVYNHVGGPPTAMGGLEETELPAVMLANIDGDNLVDFVTNNTDPEVRINAASSVVLDTDWEDVIAGFSSRGPSQFDLLKPDYTAPGVNILAAGWNGPDAYTFLQGTSMSSPHAAGAAALLVQRNPGWSVAEIKSALALTADQDMLHNDGVTPAGFFDMGSGRIDLAMAANIGLVMDETIANYEAANPELGGDPKSLNQPSMINQLCPEVCEWTRTVRSTLSVTATYTATITAPVGITVTVNPPTFTIPAGSTQTFTVTADATGQPYGDWHFAQLSLEGETGIASVNLPIAFIPVEPAPVIFAPSSFSSPMMAPNEVATTTLTIRNIGSLDLDWELFELAGAPDNQLASTGSGVIWDQPRVGNSGRINNFSNPDDTGIYQSSAFMIFTDVDIDYIFAEGFFLGGSLADATALNWYIYEDADGSPAGNPEDGLNNHVWNYTASVGDPGVDISDNNMTLDLTAAGEAAIELEAGTYWLLAYPDLPVFSLGPNILYAWFHSGTGTGQQIGPEGLLDFPTSWSGVPEGRAFRLEGQVDCGAGGDISWLDASPTSGTINPGGLQDIDVTFDSTGFLAGQYTAALCLITNDPDNEAVVIPTTLNVVADPIISVEPNMLAASLEAGMTATQVITISNSGLDVLEWTIEEAVSPAMTSVLTTSEVLFDQTANTTTSGVLAIYDLDEPETWAVQAADDFRVPDTQTWTIETVFADGFYAGLVNPATEVNVFFYEDDNGLPGAEIYSALDLMPADDDDGALTLDLPEAVVLSAGHYWVSVQPKMDFFGDGRWFWFSESVQTYNEFAWRNPGNGYGTGCTDWSSRSDCGFANPDLTFQLLGTRIDQCADLQDLPWVSVSPANGMTAPGESDTVEVTFDVGSLAVGTYTGNLCISSNDPETPVTYVSLELMVETMVLYLPLIFRN